MSGWLAYAYIHRNYRRAVFAAEDVYTGLAYFAEAHQGRFPDSEVEFRKSDFVENLKEGRLRILRREASAYCPRAYGITIDSLSEFKIAWGTNLDSLRLNEAGRLVDWRGREVRLMSVYLWGRLCDDLSGAYTKGLYDICTNVRSAGKHDD